VARTTSAASPRAVAVREIGVRTKTTAAVIALSLLLAADAIRADDNPAPAAVDHLALGVGWYDAHRRDYEALDLRAEYRWRGVWRQLRPWAGVELTTDEVVYFAGGFTYDFRVGDFFFVPMLGAGLYDAGDGKDLGHRVEFRTALEVGFRLHGEARLALSYGHMSNAGLSDPNPGVEVLGLYWLIPLGRQTGTSATGR